MSHKGIRKDYMSDFAHSRIRNAVKRGLAQLKQICGCNAACLSEGISVDVEQIYEMASKSQYSKIGDMATAVFKCVSKLETKEGTAIAIAPKIRRQLLQSWDSSWKEILARKEEVNAEQKDLQERQTEVPLVKKQKHISFAGYNEDDNGEFHMDLRETNSQQKKREESWDMACLLRERVAGRASDPELLLLSLQQVNNLLDQGRAEKRQKLAAAQDLTAAAAMADLGGGMTLFQKYVSRKWARHQIKLDRLKERLCELTQSEAEQARELADQKTHCAAANVILSFEAIPRIWRTLSKASVRDALFVREEEKEALRVLETTRAEISSVEGLCDELECRQRDASGKSNACMLPRV